MTNVYAWPPVKATGAYFTQEHPVSKSRGLQGGDLVSSAWQARRIASLAVSGIQNGGGGYIEALKRLLLGGVHLVRLTTLPAHWNGRWIAPRGQFLIEWDSGGDPVEWDEGGDPVGWLAGSPLTAVLVSDPPFQALDVSGFAPGAVAAYPDEVVVVDGVATRSLTLAVANAAGVARLRVVDTLPGGGDVQIGVRETGVYRIESDIETFQRPGAVFGYDLSFREVFEAETDGFLEINPWR